ncbi:MAG: NAD(P)H-dependent oxidoreductase [Chromatiaceae bacterium]
MSKKPTILVLFAHLSIRRSKINRAMVEAIRDLEHVVFRDLLEMYPDFYIDVAEEQRALRSADLLVLQHPIYWYSAPAIITHWQDVVLTRGFAYGPGGTALHGKEFMHAVSTGGPPDSYREGGVHGYPLAELLRPFEQMARFCGMRAVPALVLQGGHDLTDATIAAHAQRYRELLERYRPGMSGGKA